MSVTVVTETSTEIPTMTEFEALAARVSALESGGNRVVACVIKPNSSGVWDILSDTVHSSIGVSSVEQNSTTITLHFDFEADKILTFIAAPDETLAKARFEVGASVGQTLAVISMANPSNSPVNPSTVTNTSANIWIYGLFTVVSQPG